jgi:hypothetical protein
MYIFFIFHTLVKLCARKNTIQLKVENIENANNTHIKQTKKDRYRLGKSISFSQFKFKNCKPSHQTTLKSFVFLR